MARAGKSVVIIEVGGRDDTNGDDSGSIAIAARYQQAMGQHAILRLDGFIAGREHASPSSGLRTELVVKF